MSFVSCESWRPKEILTFDETNCLWLGKDKEYKCDDPQLFDYMAIPIQDYIDFTKNYKCRENK